MLGVTHLRKVCAYPTLKTFAEVTLSDQTWPCQELEIVWQMFCCFLDVKKNSAVVILGVKC